MTHRYQLSCIVLLIILCLCLAVIPANTASQGSVPNSRQRQVELRSSPIASLPDNSKRWALIVGADRYDDRQITSLMGASNDAKLLSDTLVKYAGFPQQQVILLATDQPLERQPTRSLILKYLANLRRLVPHDGLLLIAFSGHGIESKGRAYLLPSDALASNDQVLLEDTAIAVDRIKETVKASGVGQVVIILDACRRDPLAGRSNDNALLSEAFTKGLDFDVRNRDVTAFVTLYSTSVGHRAYEYTEKKQGYFMWAMVEALKGRAANDKGEVTLGRVVKYLEDTVPKLVKRDLGWEKEQRPFAIIEGYKADELILSLSAATKSTINGLPLRTFEFQVVVAVDLGGRPVKKLGTGQLFAEELGGAVTLEMVRIPGGTFLMGTSQKDTEQVKRQYKEASKYYGFNSSAESETPQHRVTVPSFFIGKVEVTNAQWKAVAKLPKVNTDLSSSTYPNAWPNKEGPDSEPVAGISWGEAVEFCERLTRATGRRYRLPTEAEWEYACRAGSTTLFAFGNAITSELVNFNPMTSYLDDMKLDPNMTVASSGVANAFGLYDMHGNVSEYCQDTWHTSYLGAPADGSAWIQGGEVSKNTGSRRVIRGGVWFAPAVYCRSAARDSNPQNSWSDATGFRVVMEP